MIVFIIFEEYVYYFDGEVNSFDIFGDEGEIFVSFVLGEELSEFEFLWMKVEDDWVIVFLNGNIIIIE